MTTGLSNADFKKAAEDVKTLSNKPDNATLLKVRTAGGFHPAYKCAYSSKLYALFKQATVGDNETEAPGMMDFTVSSTCTLSVGFDQVLSSNNRRGKPNGTPGTT